MPPESNPGPGPGPGPIDLPPARRVPNLEEINWKKRALDAEAALEAAKTELAAVTERCATHERNIESITKLQAEAEATAARERAISDALSPHHPIDAALCATLIEREIERELEREGAEGDGLAGDLASRLGPVVTKLVADRPYLFRAPTRTAAHPSAGATMAGAPVEPGSNPIESALDEARSSGSRSQLLRYLRLRRGA